jgi:hypothetical protein
MGMQFPPTAHSIASWVDFEKSIGELPLPDRWVFRGVLSSWEPITSIERARRSWNFHWNDLPDLESRLTRDFLRHRI